MEEKKDGGDSIAVPKKRRRLMGIYASRMESEPSRTRGSVRSLWRLTGSYSKRRGPTYFSYSIKDTVVLERSPYQVYLEGFNVENNGERDVRNCDVATLIVDGGILIERRIRALNRVMNDRISSLWSLKESMLAKMIHVVSMRCELSETAALYSKLVLVIKADNHTSSRKQYFKRVLISLDDSLKRFIPQYCTRMQNYLLYTVRENISFGLNQFLTMHRRVFLIASRQQLPLLNIVNINCAWRRSSLSAKSSCTKLEQHLCGIVRHPVESLDGAFIQLYEHKARIGSGTEDCEYMRSLNAEDRDLYALTVNCSLACLMDCISEHSSVEFDELGVYRLLRVIEQLQSFVATVKQRRHWPVIVSDQCVWRRAENALRVLSCCAQQMGDADRAIPAVDRLLSRAEEQSWRSKVKLTRYSSCRPAKGGNSGRVFAMLELQYDNL